MRMEINIVVGRRGEVEAEAEMRGEGGRAATEDGHTSISPTSLWDPAVLLTTSTLPGPNVSRHSRHTSWGRGRRSVFWLACKDLVWTTAAHREFRD